MVSDDVGIDERVTRARFGIVSRVVIGFVYFMLGVVVEWFRSGLEM